MLSAMDKLESYLFERGNISHSPLLRDVAYDRLQDAVIHAGLQPGDPLSETRISKALGISRTPVREAIQQLAKEGLLQIIPGRAITVAAPSMQDVLDAIHVRELLEPEVVRLAADNLPATQRQSLRSLTEEMERAARAGDRRSWSKADIKWHEILCNFCPNRLLGQMTLEARNRIYTKAADEHVADQYLIEGTLEHLEIVEAILAREAATAERLMVEHIRSVRDNMFKHWGRY